MLFVCYPKCSTCKKAEAWLVEKGISFQKRDIKAVSYTHLRFFSSARAMSSVASSMSTARGFSE